MDMDVDKMPVRDAGRTDGLTQKQRALGRLEREELEDKYLRMYDENLLLKKHARKQEEKIKRMATKLLRLVSDKKKADQDHGVKKVRDIETEEMLEDLHGKIRDLEKHNQQLKEKLMVYKQQLTSQGKRNTPYTHVPSRIDTGIQKATVEPRIQKGMRVTGPPPSSRSITSPGLPRYGQSLLDDARTEIRHQEDVIAHLNEQINIYEQDIEMLKEQSRVREAEFEEDLLKIKQQMTQGQRNNIQENIDIIRLQREVKEKSTKLTALQAQYANLEEKMHTVKSSHDQVLAELEQANSQLQKSESHVLSLQNQLKTGSSTHHTLVQLQEQVADLEREKDILKEANEKLVNSAFDMEREREWRKRENSLKVQIAQLEATLKSDVGEKGTILDKLTGERESHEKLQDEHKELRIKYFQLKHEMDELKEKMGFFTQESAVDFQEIEEALMIVKQRKTKGDQELEFLQKVEDEKQIDNSKLVRELQAEHAETINELEKTRNMLIVQHKINKDYQQEVDAVTRKMEQDGKEYEAKLEEYAQLLDIRAARIRKLEAQLRDVAYGTRQHRIRPQDEGSDVEEIDETVHLERGQNLMEIHVKRVVLTPEGLKAMGDDEPSLFCTWEFFEFEIQATPVMRGPKPEFTFTSQYQVKVDDFLLHYLQKDSTTLELHQSFGTDYRTVAACQLKMREILDKSGGRYHATAQLTGLVDNGTGINYGTVEYWVRLRVPMDQALRLYKERSKALGYMTANVKAGEQALQAMDEEAAQRPDGNINQLHIKVIKCADLKARREGVQPSPFCVYKFFDFDDHDSSIIVGSNNPQFNDHKTFPVPMTHDLDRYLKAQPLLLYVFDDVDPDETAHLGFASVPLIPLAHDKAIKGIFELKQDDGTVCGNIEIHLNWQYTYIPPKASTRTAAQILATTPDKPERVTLLPGEELPQPGQSPMLSRAPGAVPMTPSSMYAQSAPIASSTPARRELLPERDTDSQVIQPVARQSEMAQPPPAQPDITVTAAGDEAVSLAAPQDTQPEPPMPQVQPIEAAARLVQSTPIQEESEPSEATPARVPKPHPKPRRFLGFAARISPRAKKKLDLEDTLQDEGEEDIAMTMDQSPESVHAMRGLQSVTPQSDTMFGDEPSIEEEIATGEDGTLKTDRTERSDRSESDSDVVMSSPVSRPSSVTNAMNSDIVTVTIAHLSLEEDSRIMNDPAIQMLFVEYRFLGVDLSELETPFSLPKPKPYSQITFNFKKVFHVDYDKNYEKRQYLASMLLPDDPEEGRIRFTVVSEPPENNQDADCEDVGFAFVSIRDILSQKKDVVETDVPIVDVTDEVTQIGSLNVTVECLSALLAVEQEMKTD